MEFSLHVLGKQAESLLRTWAEWARDSAAVEAAPDKVCPPSQALCH